MKFLLRPGFIFSAISGVRGTRKSTKDTTGFLKLLPWLSWGLLLIFQYVSFMRSKQEERLARDDQEKRDR